MSLLYLKNLFAFFPFKKEIIFLKSNKLFLKYSEEKIDTL